jgi:hypothetical protein
MGKCQKGERNEIAQEQTVFESFAVVSHYIAPHGSETG